MNGIKGMRFYPSGSNGLVDARDIAEISIKMMVDPDRYSGQHLLIGENLSFKTVFDRLAAIANKPGPSIKVPNSLIRVLIRFMRLAEWLGWNGSSLTANSLKSSITQQYYSNEKVRDLGFSFRSFDEAAEYTWAVYQSRSD